MADLGLKYSSTDMTRSAGSAENVPADAPHLAAIHTEGADFALLDRERL